MIENLIYLATIVVSGIIIWKIVTYKSDDDDGDDDFDKFKFA